MAGRPECNRASSTLHLSHRETQSAPAVHGDIRSARVAHELWPARIEHPRTAGVGTAQRAARERTGGGVCGTAGEGDRRRPKPAHRTRLLARGRAGAEAAGALAGGGLLERTTTQG